MSTDSSRRHTSSSKKKWLPKKKIWSTVFLNEAVAGVAKKGEKLTAEMAGKVAKEKKGETVKVKPFVTLDIEYLNAIVEDRKIIAHARISLDDHRNINEQMVGARVKGHPETIEAEALDYIDVSVKQCISIATALIPFPRAR
jgi:DNA-directed RNA polymerase beta subunit